MFGRGVREELDDQDAEVLAAQLRESLAEVIREDEAAKGRL